MKILKFRKVKFLSFTTKLGNLWLQIVYFLTNNEEKKFPVLSIAHGEGSLVSMRTVKSEV